MNGFCVMWPQNQGMTRSHFFQANIHRFSTTEVILINRQQPRTHPLFVLKTNTQPPIYNEPNLLITVSAYILILNGASSPVDATSTTDLVIVGHFVAMLSSLPSVWTSYFFRNIFWCIIGKSSGERYIFIRIYTFIYIYIYLHALIFSLQLSSPRETWSSHYLRHLGGILVIISQH